MAAWAWLVVLACMVAACQPGKFEDYAAHAPIRVHPAPAHYSAVGYGNVLATFHGKVSPSDEASRIVASAGGATPIVFARAWTGRSVSERSFQRCKDPGECRFASDVGATLIPFETWGASLAQPRYGCVYAPGNAVAYDTAGSFAVPGGEAYIVCENPKSPQNFELGLAAVQGQDASLQFSGFGLPAAHPLGVLLLGVHALDYRTGQRRNGGLYRQLDRTNDETGGVTPELIPLVDPATGEPFAQDPEAGDLGRQVAGAFNGAGELVIAIAQPARQRVIVASYDAKLPGDELEKFRVRACVEASDASLRGFGERLAVGDVTGDGAPELFIGIDPIAGAEPGRQALFMYSGTGLPEAVEGARVCPPWNDSATAIDCPERAGGPSCAGAGFGASLALGDVDADGHGDLIVGAPLAAVDGAPDAGTVWIVPGAQVGLDAARAIFLTTDASAGAHLGATVGALRTQGRDEPVAGAPGVDEIYMFTCTTLESGFEGSDLCLPR